MLKKKKYLLCSFLLPFTLTVGSFGKSHATPYPDKFEWDRNIDYSTGSNPHADQLGNNVWSYEWFTNGNYATTTLMNKVATWGPRWEKGPLNISGWDQNTNYDAQWNTTNQTSLIRWTNPVEDGAAIDIDGSLQMFWGGTNNGTSGFVASPIEVQIVMGHYDSSEMSINLLHDQTISSDDPLISNPFAHNSAGQNIDTVCTSFGLCPKILIPLDFSISMDLGDSFFWTAIPLSQVNPNRWITLNDYNMKISYSNPVPEPVSMLLFGSGIVGLAGIQRRKKKELQA